MGFIHHTTGAAEATGLMDESARTRGSVSFGHPRLFVTDLTDRSISTARIAGRPLCNADHAAASGGSHPGRKATRPIPATRFRIVKGLDH